MIGDRRYFSCSNKSEITWIETKHDPLSQVIAEFDRGELTLMICRRGEVRGGFSDLDHFVCLLYWLW
jgi:hypothetical protein